MCARWLRRNWRAASRARAVKFFLGVLVQEKVKFRALSFWCNLNAMGLRLTPFVVWAGNDARGRECGRRRGAEAGAPQRHEERARSPLALQRVGVVATTVAELIGHGGRRRERGSHHGGVRLCGAVSRRWRIE
jgi:hypothetical protein